MSSPFFKKVFDFLLFTSFFIASCAAVMIYQTAALIVQKPVNFHFAGFVFFSALCSYNFHWFLTPTSAKPSLRLQWDLEHKNYHLLLTLAGLSGALLFFFFLLQHWFYLGIAVVITFLYTAPEISFPSFRWLKKIAIGKTIFLAMAWTYVTAVLPVIIEEAAWTEKAGLFSIGQFFFICSICILFDYRDREDDKADGIRSMIAWLNERGINTLFVISITLFVIFALLLRQAGFLWANIIILVIPALALISLYKHAKKNFSDYLYYFILDGLMMLAGLIVWVVNRF